MFVEAKQLKKASKMKKIEKALKSIIKSNEYSSWMEKPFTIGNNVYSTDCYCMIKVNKELVSVFDYCQKEESSNIIINLFDFKQKNLLTIDVELLKHDLAKIPLVDECGNSDTEGKCKECDGDGTVEWEYQSHMKEMDCPECDGDGVITESNKLKTGRKIKAEGYFIDFNNTRFTTCIIEELINVAGLLEVSKIELINQTSPNKPITFQIGVVQMLLMPVLFTENQNLLAKYIN